MARPTKEGQRIYTTEVIADYCYHCGQKLEWNVEE